MHERLLGLYESGGIRSVIGGTIEFEDVPAGLEVLERPVTMTALQSRPVPALELPPIWNRFFISESFVGLRFRLPVLKPPPPTRYRGALLLNFLSRDTRSGPGQPGRPKHPPAP